MKKIVALVLSLVMVLGLATTAFAAADTYDLYQADAGMAAAMKVGSTAADYADVTIDEVAAKVNKDGSGNVAYMVIDSTVYAAKTTAPTVSSFAVCEKGKTAVLYYVDLAVAGTTAAHYEYAAEVKAFADFGLKCGQVNVTPNVGDTFFEDETGHVWKAAPAVGVATAQVLLNGKIVVGEGTGYNKITHNFVANNYKYDATLKTNVPTSAICTTCLTTTTAIYENGKAPAGSTVMPLDVNGYCVVLGAASAPAVDGEKVESAETFDAGIAMYVGMSVMAAAGSAVVLKKKD